MDFFAAKAAESSKSSDDVDGFAKAIANRFKTNPVITANLNAPPPRRLSTPSAPLPPDRFKSLLAKDIQPLLNDPNVLFIDIRPHAAYVSARLPNALSLSVPSTLLKRPLFPLDRLAAMLPSPSARARFNKWRQTSTLIVYDVDSAGSPSGHLPEGNNILGLLRKFANDPQGSYQGQLLWLKGGFQTVWKERRDLVDTRPVDSELDDDEPSSSMLQPKHLPMSAFGVVSTTVNKPAQSPSRLTSSRPLLQAPSSMAFNPFFDTIRQNVELSQGITERIPLRIPKHVRRRIKDLPFAWLQEIGRRAEVKPDDESTDESDRSPKSASPDSNRVSTVSFPSQSTSSLSTSSDSTGTPPDPAMVDEGMEALAMQFYRIELAEQRRLMGVMQHHTKESEKGSGPAPSSSSMQTDEHASSSSPDNMRDISKANQTSVPFPYSITAGIEKGTSYRFVGALCPTELLLTVVFPTGIVTFGLLNTHEFVSIRNLRLPSLRVAISSTRTLFRLTNFILISHRGLLPQHLH